MAEKKSKPQARSKGFTDDQKEKRIHEHLTNESDIITEQDIRNVRTDITPDVPLTAPTPENEIPALKKAGNLKKNTPKKID